MSGFFLSVMLLAVPVILAAYDYLTRCPMCRDHKCWDFLCIKSPKERRKRRMMWK